MRKPDCDVIFIDADASARALLEPDRNVIFKIVDGPAAPVLEPELVGIFMEDEDAGAAMLLEPDCEVEPFDEAPLPPPRWSMCGPRCNADDAPNRFFVVLQVGLHARAIASSSSSSSDS